MAILRYFFIWSVASSTATYMAFSLGPKLPIVARNAGRTIGMWFNYFKVMIRVLTPDAEEANLILS